MIGIDRLVGIFSGFKIIIKDAIVVELIGGESIDEEGIRCNG